MNTQTRNENVIPPQQRQLRTLHLFAGAGGGILADLLLGHRPVGAVEIEKYPRRVLFARQRDGMLPRFPIWDDVSTFDGKAWRGRVDVICGGFPCQDISNAGKGAGIEGERSGMWKHMARIIGEIRPKYAFVENSPMLVGRGLAVVLGDLAEMGYNARWCVLGAVDAGAPHRRDRIWILATDSNKKRFQITQKTRHSISKQKVYTNIVQYGNGVWSQAHGRNTFDTWKTLLDEFCRMDDGMGNYMDRLKAIGNGQVPQVAALAWRILSNQ